MNGEVKRTNAKKEKKNTKSEKQLLEWHSNEPKHSASTSQKHKSIYAAQPREPKAIIHPKLIILKINF